MLRQISGWVGILLILPFCLAAQISMEVSPVSNTGWPGLQSFAWATDGQVWLVMGGRTDGLHRRQPWATFLPEGANDRIWVLDPGSGDSWSAETSTLPVSVREQLASTNLEFFSRDGHLYMIGGYGYSPTEDEHITHPALLSADISGLIQAVTTGGDLAAHFRQIQDERFRVSGGGIGLLGDTCLLVGGQDFEGRYNPMGPDHGPGFFQAYTNAIRRFVLEDDGVDLTVTGWSEVTDSLELHRRDYNLVPQIFPDGTCGLTAFSGVFRVDEDLPWLNTVDIRPEGYAVVPGFNQYLNQYHTAHVALWDPVVSRMMTVFFGGIGQFYLDDQGILVQDDQVPFVRTISLVSREADGTMEESVIGDMGDYLGAGAEFIPAPGLALAGEGILDTGNWPEGTPVHIGWVYGGIRSDAANIFFDNEGDLSEASPVLWMVMATKATASGLEAPRVTAEGYFRLRAYPNPVSDKLHIHFRLHRREAVQLGLVDPSGQQVGRHFSGILDPGDQEFEWDLSGLPSGAYVLKLTNGAEFEVERMVVR